METLKILKKNQEINYENQIKTAELSTSTNLSVLPVSILTLKASTLIEYIIEYNILLHIGTFANLLEIICDVIYVCLTGDFSGILWYAIKYKIKKACKQYIIYKFKSFFDKILDRLLANPDFNIKLSNRRGMVFKGCFVGGVVSGLNKKVSVVCKLLTYGGGKGISSFRQQTSKFSILVLVWEGRPTQGVRTLRIGIVNTYETHNLLSIKGTSRNEHKFKNKSYKTSVINSYSNYAQASRGKPPPSKNHI